MPDKDNMGDISIKNEVVATIASIAMAEVDGIVSLSGKKYLDPSRNPKAPDKGVKVEVDGNRARINVDIKVLFGHVIYDTAHRLQQQIKNAVENMTGLTVENVDVNVRDIVFESKPRKGKTAEESSPTKESQD